MSSIPDEFWPALLPLTLLNEGQGGSSLRPSRAPLPIRIEEQCIAFAQRGVKRLPPEAYEGPLADFLDAVGRKDVRVIPHANVQRAQIRRVAQYRGKTSCRLELWTTSGHFQHDIHEAVDSVVMDAFARLWGDRLVIGRPCWGRDIVVGASLVLIWWGVVLVAAATEFIWPRGWFDLANFEVAVASLVVLLFALGSAVLFAFRYPFAMRRAGKANPRPKARTPRKAPIYSRPFSWILKCAGLLYLLLGWFGPEVAPVVRWAIGEGEFLRVVSKGSGNGFLLEGFLLLYLGYIFGQPNLQKILDRDSRPPILFLRSFGDDGQTTFNEETIRSAILGVGVAESFRMLPRPFCYIANTAPLRAVRLFFNAAVDTAEEQLRRGFAGIGPMVAIGKPGEWTATPGAARQYVDNDSWQRVVTDLVAQASVVVLQPSLTEGVWWEVHHVAAAKPIDRVLICLWATQRSAELAVVRLRIAKAFGRPLPILRPGDAFVWFDRLGGCHVLGLQRADPFRWPLLGTSCDMVETLRPFLSAIRDPNFAQVGKRTRLEAAPDRSTLLAIITYVVVLASIYLAVGEMLKLLVASLASPPSP